MYIYNEKFSYAYTSHILWWEVMGPSWGPTDHGTRRMERAILDGPKYQFWCQLHTSKPFICAQIFKKKFEPQSNSPVHSINEKWKLDRFSVIQGSCACTVRIGDGWAPDWAVCVLVSYDTYLASHSEWTFKRVKVGSCVQYNLFLLLYFKMKEFQVSHSSNSLPSPLNIW